MQILDQFGFNPLLFFGQIVNFLVLAFIFKKFLYKPILKTLRERKLKIEKGIKDAEAAEKAKLLAEQDHNKILKKATIEAEKIIEETKVQAQDLKDSILTEAKKEAEKIITQAKADADSQMIDMEKRAKSASLDISEKVLMRIADSLFTGSEKQEIVKRGVSMITKSE